MTNPRACSHKLQRMGQWKICELELQVAVILTVLTKFFVCAHVQGLIDVERIDAKKSYVNLLLTSFVYIYIFKIKSNFSLVLQKMMLKKQPNLRPHISAYHECHRFLSEWLNYLQRSGYHRSLREFASQAEISQSHLTRILSGKRPLSEKALEKLIPHLRLNETDVKKLDLLRRASYSQLANERVRAFKKHQSYREYANSNRSEQVTFEYLSHWYYVAIRELSFRKDFKPNPTWIKKKLTRKVPKREVERALSFLLKHGFIRKQGRNHQPSSGEKLIRCTDEVYAKALVESHRQNLNLAIESISLTPRQERLLHTLVISISEENLKAAQNLMEKLISDLKKLETKKKANDPVYSFGLYSIPLAR